MKIKMQLITGFSLLAVVMAVVQIATFIGLSSLSTSGQWVVHTYRVIGAARQVEKLALDLESGMRGFLLTGDETYLLHQMDAKKKHEEAIKDLKAQVADNSPQVFRLTEIEQRLFNWHETVSKPVVELRRKMDRQAQNGETAAELSVAMQDIELMVRSGENNPFMDNVRALLNEFISVEQQLVEERHHATELAERFNRILLITGTAFFLIIGGITLITVLRNIFKQVGGEPAEIAAITDRIANGDLDIDITSSDQTGILASVLTMFKSLKKNRQKINDQNWLSKQIANLDDAMRGSKKLDELCEDIITDIARILDAQVGTLSLTNPDGYRLTLTASYAFSRRPGTPTEFRFGEGLIGQAAQDSKRILVKNVPENSLTITSALGEILPHSIVCFPLVYDDKVNGVIELGSMQPFTELQLEFLNETGERIAIAINTAQARERMKVLLEESQALAEELQAQQEELKTANEELELRSQELETQQEELRVANKELEEKTAEMETRREENDDERNGG